MRLAGALAVLLLAVSTAQAASLRVCTTDWPPYTVDRRDRVGGIHAEMTREAFRRLGFTVEIESVAWERCWAELPKDTYQAIFSASYRPERAAVALYPATPLQSLSYVAVVRRADLMEWDGRDLGRLPQPLAAPRGYSVVDDLRSRGVRVDDGAMRDAQNIEKLLAGRIGTAVVERSVAEVLLRDMAVGGKVAVLAAPVGPPKDYFLVVGRKAGGSEEAARRLADRLGAVLADMAREGFLARQFSAEGLNAPGGRP